ncbi:uncharacterized protein MCYG_07882 [Microsporum canis CBS 113480]|uniref:Uncharacterized protein n=1 Tax=Arthroderma otae (strain ATCC MYA-4605 / CBS 113480) TaxID=554155 RepID=C5FXM3_ARTOC|nr:uncharacterized protein MCYG_07882 [Microsporum canis CBS 113480]EEQ35063.1 predicted protein [Microsporum canis CBS 113480]
MLQGMETAGSIDIIIIIGRHQPSLMRVVDVDLYNSMVLGPTDHAVAKALSGPDLVVGQVSHVAQPRRQEQVYRDLRLISVTESIGVQGTEDEAQCRRTC